MPGQPPSPQTPRCARAFPGAEPRSSCRDISVCDAHRRSKSVMADARVNGCERDVLLMLSKGLVSQNSQEDVVIQGSGLSRGDRRRNAQLARLRELVPVDNAIIGIDLADEKQAIVLTNHDSQVLARRRVKAKAWWMGPVLGWGRTQAPQLGFPQVTVGCEA